MKKTSIMIFCVLCVLIIYKYYKKNYIQFELECEFVGKKIDFRPDAYLFFHNKADFISYCKMTKQENILSDNLKLDFDKYSYLLVYGRRIKQMYYGWENSIKKDKSPSYGKIKNTTFVSIKYEEKNEGIVFMYRIRHNQKFRGFNGL